MSGAHTGSNRPRPLAAGPGAASTVMAARRGRDAPRSRGPGPEAQTATVRIMIADADALARRAVRGALEAADGIAVVAEAADGREALALARHHRPSIVLVDTALPPWGPIWLLGELAVHAAGTCVLLLAAREDDHLAIDALRAGAVGHVSKHVSPEVLPHLVTKVDEGEAIIPRRLALPLLECLREVPPTGWRPLRSRLTSREWEIVDLLAGQASTLEIADRLVLAPATVYSHIKSLLRKLGVRSRREAVAEARRLRREEVVRWAVPTCPR